MQQRGTTQQAGTDAQPGVSLEPLAMVLTQIRRVVNQLTDEQYPTSPVPTLQGTIGGHVRHNLDHIHAWLAGLDTGWINYDNRQRGTEVETDRHAALDAVDRLLTKIGRLNLAATDQPLTVLVAMTNDGQPVALTSNAARELGFVLSHTVHHNAMIGAMAGALGVTLPEHFGYAPSTVAFLNRKPCAR